MEVPSFETIPKDVQIKIFACADLEAKKIMRCLNRYYSLLTAENLITHSPLIMSRKDHLMQMIAVARYADRKESLSLFNNLIDNAHLCDHADALERITYFILLGSDEAHWSEHYAECGDTESWDELLLYAMSVYAGDEYALCNYKIKRSLNSPGEWDLFRPLNLTPYCDEGKSAAELFIAQDITALNAMSEHGLTPLCEAVGAENLYILEYLLSFPEIDCNGSINDGNTPLHLAVIINNKSILDLLLKQKGININAKNSKDQASLWKAAENGFNEMITSLILHGADIELATNGPDDVFVNYTPLCVAINNNYIPTTRILLEMGANPNVFMQSGEFIYTPLLLAAFNNQCDIIELLLQGSADIEAVDHAGETALIKAVRNNYVDLVKLLCEYDANVGHKTFKGKGIEDFILFDTQEGEEIRAYLHAKFDHLIADTY